MAKTKITQVMMDDSTLNVNKEVDMVFSIANTLRGPYKADKYKDIIIPMIGMVQSLNVSVASALILYEAQRQRQNAGMYLRENSMLPEAEQQRLLFEGGYPVLAKVAKRKDLPYPHVNQQGEIEADADWWATMQAAG